VTTAFDIAAMGRQLAAGELPERGVLDASWQVREDFQRALLAEAARSFGANKSRSSENYDFYADLISRHTGQRADAMVYRGPSGQLLRLSYDALDASVVRLCASLRAQGVAAGDSVAIVQPVGAFYATALLAALRLGLVVSCIRPRGRSFVRARLAQLAPTHILADRQHAWYAQPVPVLDTTALPEQPGHDSGSHSYAAVEPVFRAMATLEPDPGSAIELSAEAAYAALLRDAVLILPVRKGERVAAPGLDADQYQPQLLLATWLAGGCYLACELEELAGEPTLLDRFDPQLLGVGQGLLQQLAQSNPPARLPGLRRYFFNPLEGLDLGPLERIARAAEPPRVLSGFGIVAHAAHGGTLLCSAKSIRATLPRYIPAPGLAWWLTEANLTGTRALFDTGLLVVGEETDPTSHAAASAHLMIAGQAGAYQLAGSATSLRAGRAYPVRLVSDVITEHPGVDHCVALTVRDPTNMYRAVAFALVFVDPSEPTRVRARAAELARELEERVHQELGADLVPDQIRIFAHTPALQDAGPDRAYCQAQFLDGMLDKKATHGAFCALSALRRLFASVPGTP
jgi:hypothetical protein